MVPKNVSLFFIETLNTLQQKRAEQKTHNITMENRLNFEKEKLNTAVGTKRLRQTQIDELVDYEAIALANKKISSGLLKMKFSSWTKISRNLEMHESCSLKTILKSGKRIESV